MKKSFLSMTAGILIGAMAALLVPGNIQITIAQGPTSEEIEIASIEDAVEIEEVVEKDEDTVASETTGIVYEGVSDDVLAARVLQPVKVNLNVQSMIRTFNSYRMSTGRKPVVVEESLVDMAQMYNQKFMSGEEEVFSGEISNTQYMYAGVSTGIEAELSGASIINFWMDMEIGRHYLLEENVEFVGASVEKKDGKMFFVLILDWGSVR